ncbi:hypothetical protein BGZ67_005366 [Mortierella alpina]|nr:hypothetical protein BGZ67_005366 [Mortierella alpina]
MTPQLPPSKGSRMLMGYRRSLIILAIIMLALDCATIGLFASLMNPGYDYFYGLSIDKPDYALLLIADLVTIVFFALLVFRPQGLVLLNKLSSRVLTNCRVFFSLGLTVLVLYEPAMELERLMEFKFELNYMAFRDEPAVAREFYMDYVFCGRRYTPEGNMARTNQQYCQVARARWILGFVLAVLVFGELLLSYWARNFKVHQGRDETLRTGTDEYKTMIET